MYVIATKYGLCSESGRPILNGNVNVTPSARDATVFSSQPEAGTFKSRFLAAHPTSRVLRLVSPGSKAVASSGFYLNGKYGFLHAANFAHLSSNELAHSVKNPVSAFISARGHDTAVVVRSPEYGTLFIVRGLAYTKNFAKAVQFADSLDADAVGNRLFDRESAGYFAILRQ
jgi:hypothetical protein